MSHVVRVLLFAFFVVSCVAGGVLRASVLVSSSLSLTQFQITPSAGSIEFVTPLISPPGCALPNLCATAFSQAQDSQGGLQQRFNVADNGATSATATTTLATANSAASAPAKTESASGSVNINLLSAFGSSTAQGTLYGTFQVVGTTSPVIISFAATLSGSQMLSTDAYGLSASSEVIFSLVLDNGDIPISYDNPLSIGPSSFLSVPFSMTLNGSSSPIPPGTNVSIVSQVDVEIPPSVNSVPEPSTLFLLLAALVGLGLNARRQLAVRGK